MTIRLDSVFARLEVMNTPPHESQYPQSSIEFVVARELQSLREIMRDGFDGIGKRVDRIEDKFEKVVTQSEFSSVVQRLDMRDEMLETRVENEFKELKSDVAAGFEQVKASDKERNSKNRWFWGAMIAAAGVISSVTFSIINAVIN